MEELGYCAEIFTLDGIAGIQRKYIQWLLATCSEQQNDGDPILTEDAIDLLATKLRTPLQVQQRSTLTLEAGYLTGERPVTAELVDSVLSRKLAFMVEGELIHEFFINGEYRNTIRMCIFQQQYLENHKSSGGTLMKPTAQ